jgi:nucleotide-binding universal stress UspA family protein
MSGAEHDISDILIATDGSVYADAAVDCGAWLASHLGAKVTAIYVIDPRRLAGHFIKHLSEIIGSRRSEGLLERIRDYYQNYGREVLDRSAAISERYGVACEKKLESGNVVSVLAAASADMDLLVLGQRGEDEEFETGFLGSVVERVLRTVDQPVLITHLLFREFHAALLAYDGSAAARRAMKMLARLAVALHLDIDAVQLVGEGEPTTALKNVAEYFKQYPVHLSTHYLVGDSHSLILDHLKEAKCDLMAMGAFDNKVADRLALGSTTEYLMRNSPVPVLVHH